MGIDGPPPGFELACGSIPGRHHLGRGGHLVGRNNQDAFAVCEGPEGLVAAVCDGCSGGARSEVGATLGARWIAAAVWEELVLGRNGSAGRRGEVHCRERQDLDSLGIERALDRVRRRCLARLRLVAGTLGGDLFAALEETSLFTVLLAACTPFEVVVAGLGDGVVLVNGERLSLGPFPGNAPPYLAYGLWDPPPSGFSDNDLRLGLLAHRPASGVQSLLLGSDGVEDLIRAAEAGALLPGRAEALGRIEEYWTKDRLFANPDALRRTLALANSEPFRRDARTGAARPATGLLPDDTTIVVIRQRRGSRAEGDGDGAEGPDGRTS